MLNLLKALYLIGMFYLANFGSVLAITTSGEITSNETWSGTVVITGDIVVSNGKLTINPGAEIKFNTTNDNVVYGASGNIVVAVKNNGIISAIGSEDQQIKFTSAAASPQRGNWGYIQIIENGTRSSFRYCILEYGKRGFWIKNPDGLTGISKPNIGYCEIRYKSYSGIGIESGSTINISKCLIHDCVGGLFFNEAGNTSVSDTYIYNVSYGIVFGNSGTGNLNHISIYNVDMMLVSKPSWWSGYFVYEATPVSINITNSIFNKSTFEGDCYYITGRAAGDGMYNDPANGDLRLQTGSPCWNAASDGGHVGAWQSGDTWPVWENGELNNKPVIVSLPETVAYEDSLYEYDVDAIDSNVTDTLVYSLVIKPNGMTIDQSTGLVQWSPTGVDVGTAFVKVEVNDGRNGTDFQEYDIFVIRKNDNIDQKIVNSTGNYYFEETGVGIDIDAIQGNDTISITVKPDNFPPNAPVGVNALQRHYEISCGAGITNISAVVTLPYLQEEFGVSGINVEKSLCCGRYDGSDWEYLPSNVDTSANTVICSTGEFSVWGIFESQDVALTEQYRKRVFVEDFAMSLANSSTGITVYIELGIKKNLQVTVNDAQGKMVGTVFSGVLNAGQHRVSYNYSMEPGIYCIRVTGNGVFCTRKVLVLE